MNTIDLYAEALKKLNIEVKEGNKELVSMFTRTFLKNYDDLINMGKEASSFNYSNYLKKNTIYSLPTESPAFQSYMTDIKHEVADNPKFRSSQLYFFLKIDGILLPIRDHYNYLFKFLSGENLGINIRGTMCSLGRRHKENVDQILFFVSPSIRTMVREYHKTAAFKQSLNRSQDIKTIDDLI
jgi:hypothetical protein